MDYCDRCFKLLRVPFRLYVELNVNRNMVEVTNTLAYFRVRTFIVDLQLVVRSEMSLMRKTDVSL
jgi:hypothetical protein